MRKVLKMGDIEAFKDYVSPDVYARLKANRHLCCSAKEGTYLIAFHFCNINDPGERDDKVCIWCGENELIMASDSKKCLELISKIDENKDGRSQLLEFFASLTADDVLDLEKFEDKITDIEDVLISNKKVKSNTSASIVKMRRELLKMKRYYEQMSLIMSDIADNEDNALSEDMRKRFAFVDRRMDYLLNFVLHLREYITQVREAYQAQIDIEQNQIMKIFTVVTAVFLPLTLIVGWFGMNFQMPEYGWSFGYPYVIALSVAVCIVCIVFFKIKKWF